MIFIVVLCCSSLLCCCAFGDDTWSFAVIGDTRDNDPTTTGVSQYLPTIASVMANPSSVKSGAITPSAVFVNGDLINGDSVLFAPPSFRPDYSTQFANWKHAMKPVYNAGIPIYPVRGNHENEVTDFLPPSEILKTAYYNAFGSSVPQNGPTGQTGFTWNLSSIDNPINQKYVRMIGVDQYFYYNLTKQGTSHYYQIDQAWLNTQLTKTAPRRYTFVMAHEPAYYLDSGGDNPEGDFYGTTNPDGSVNPAGVAARAAFWNSLGANGVKAYLVCHVHNLQVGYAYDSSGNKIYQNMVGNGGAPFASQGATDSALNMAYQNFSDYGFALYTVTKDNLTINYYLYNPNTHTWSIAPYSITLLANPVYTWNTRSGIFSDESSWDVSGVPGATDTAVFDSGTGTLSTVNFKANAVNDRLFVASGVTTFNLNGYTYTANRTQIDGTEDATYLPSLAISGNGSKFITGPLSMDAGATLAVGEGASVKCSSLDVSGNSTLIAQAGSATSYGRITSSGPATISNSTNVILDVNGYILSGSQFTVVDGNGGTGVKGGLTATATSPVFTVTSNPLDSEDLTITAIRSHPYNQLANNANAVAIGALLETKGVQGASGDILDILNGLDSLTSIKQINGVLNSLTPIVNNGVSQVSYDAVNNFLGTINSHLENLRFDYNCNKPSQKNDIWAEGFGNYSHEDPRGFSNGYHASVWGTAIGYDRLLNDNVRLGASFGYANPNIKSNDDSGHTNADNYQGALYAGFNWATNYINGILSYAHNTYDSLRRIAYPIINRPANSNYNGDQYSLYLEGGHTFKMGNFELTPLVPIEYQHLRLGGYTEKNGGDLGLKVDSQNCNLFQSGLGAKLSYSIQGKYGTFLPELHIKWLYDITNDNEQSNSSFTDGSATFVTNGFTPAKNTVDAGVKLTYFTNNSIDISLNFDYQLKEDFYGYFGYLNGCYKF